MRIPILRTLCVLGIASSVGAGAPATRGNASVLSVSLYCQDDAFTCDAYAIGGTGGYTFTWTKASEYYSEPGYSAATPHCSDYIGGVYVRVTVRDGSGATATAGDGVNCNPV